MTAPRRGSDRLLVGLAMFATITWWVFFSERSALGLILPRDAISYVVGSLAFVVGLIASRRLPQNGTVVSLFLFCAYMGTQFLVRDDFRKVQVQSLIQIVFPIAFLGIGFLLWNRGRFATPLKVYVVAMAFSAFVGLLNHYTGFAQPLFILNELDRAAVGDTVIQRGGSLASVSIGTGLLVSIGILVAIGLPRRYWLAIPIFVVSLFSTLSRGGIIANGAGIVVLLWFSLPPPGPKRARVFRLAGLAAAFVFVIGLVGSGSSGGGGGVAPVLERFSSDIINPKEEGNSFRLASWQNDIDVWSKEPIFGAGLGTLGTIGVIAARENGREALAAESWYLQLLGELGIPGLLLYMFVLIGIVSDGWQSVTRGAPGPKRSLAIGALCGLGSLAFGGIFLQNLSDFIGSLFWYFAGGLIAYRAEQLALSKKPSEVFRRLAPDAADP